MCEDFTWCSFFIGIVTGLISSFVAFLITLVIFFSFLFEDFTFNSSWCE